MIRFKSHTHSPQAVLFLALLLIAAFGAACGGAKPNSTTDSASSASGASGGVAFEGEIMAKMFTDDPPADLRYAIKGNRIRVETRLGPQSGIMLMDLYSTTQTMLFPQTKTYMALNWGETAEKMANEAGKDSQIDFPKVTSAGKTETIAGITCQHWLIGDEQDMDVCLAKGLGYFGGGSGGILDKLKNLAQREKIKAQLEANPEFAKFVEGGAFPLKIAEIENGRSKTIMEVTGVERKSLDESIFSVPADYKKMETPVIPGVPGARR